MEQSPSFSVRWKEAQRETDLKLPGDVPKSKNAERNLARPPGTLIGMGNGEDASPVLFPSGGGGTKLYSYAVLQYSFRASMHFISSRFSLPNLLRISHFDQSFNKVHYILEIFQKARNYLKVIIKLERSASLPVIPKPLQLNHKHRWQGLDAHALHRSPLKGKFVTFRLR